MCGFVESGAFPGVAAFTWQAGRPVSFAAHGWRDTGAHLPIERDTIFRLASMSKPITSAAALSLVEDGILDLDAPIARWLPEAADMKVLRTPGAELDDVVLAERPPTLFDLMTHTAGFAWGKGLDLPIVHAMNDATGETPIVPHDADTLVRRACSLPLILQPGRSWHYSNGSDLLGVILARASGISLPDLLKARIFDPLGMADTGFFVPPERIDRLAIGYARSGDGFTVYDDARTGHWSRAPLFPAGGGGLVATVDDYLAFARMLLGKGTLDGTRVLSEDSVGLMTTNRLTAEQLVPIDRRVDFLQGKGFGFGLSVTLDAQPGRRSPGSFSWPGGYGTTWFADPQKRIVGMAMTQVWQEHLIALAPAFEEAVYAGLSDEE